MDQSAAPPSTVFPAVTAVISTHTRCDVLRQTLLKLADLDYPSLSVIVADNASEDDTVHMVRREFPDVLVLENQENQALRGYNLGFEAVSTPYTFVMDDDSAPREEALRQMAEILNRRPQVAAVAANIVDSNGVSEWGIEGNVAYTEDWYNLIGCGFLIRTDVLRESEWYDEAFCLYYNDLELALRLLSSCHRIAYSRDIFVDHRRPMQTRLSALKSRMMLRNFGLLVKNHFSGIMALDLISGHTLASLMQAVRSRQLGAALRGLFSALALTSHRTRQVLPPSRARDAFVRRYALSLTAKRLLKGETLQPPLPQRSAVAGDGDTGPCGIHVPRVAAAVVTHNKREAVTALLTRLSEVETPAFVTANACQDGTAEAIRQQFPMASLLESRHNLGGCGGFNCAVLAALSSGAPYIVLCDDDALPDPDCLGKLADFLDENPDYAFAAPAVYITSAPDTLQETGGDVVFARDMPVQAWNRFRVNPDLPDVLDIGYASACLLMVRAEAIMKIGVMDWNYYIFYDDVDWSLRLRRACGKGACVTSAKVYHDFPWAKPFSPMRLYYFIRNGLLLLPKLRRKDPTLRSIRSSLFRIFRTWMMASAAGDGEIAATVRHALADAWHRQFGMWSKPVSFPADRQKLSPDLLASEGARQVLLNIRVEAFTRQACDAIRQCAPPGVEIDLLCAARSADDHRKETGFREIMARAETPLALLRQFFLLRRRGYDLVVTDASMEPRTPNDMTGRFSALYHEGDIWKSARKPWRTLACAIFAVPLSMAASWLACWRFVHRPGPGRPPDEAAPLLERIGVDPTVGQPWARTWPIPFEAAPPRPRSLAQRTGTVLRRLFGRLCPAIVPPPPHLDAAGTPGRYGAWRAARDAMAPMRYDSRLHAHSPVAAFVKTPKRGMRANTHRRHFHKCRYIFSAPLFSVLVPVCDPKEHWLRDCINSVRNQTFSNWEMILVDDRSGEEQIRRSLRRCARWDRRIRIQFQTKRGGISVATNAAAALARGEYLVFLDHDDMLDPFALAAFAQALDGSPGRPGVLYADEDRFDDDGKCFWPGFKPKFSPDQLLATNYIHHPAVMRRDLFERLGGLRSQYDGSQDHDLLLRAAETGEPFVHVPDILYRMRMHPGSLVSGPEAKPEAHKRDRELIAHALQRRGIDANVEPVEGRPGLHTIHRHGEQDTEVSVIAVSDLKLPLHSSVAPAPLPRASRVARRAAPRSALPGAEHVNACPPRPCRTGGRRAPGTLAGFTSMNAHQLRLPLAANDSRSIPAQLNALARQADGDVLLFTDADATPAAGWRETLLPHVLRTDIGLVTGKIVYDDDRLYACGLVLGMNGCAGRWHHGCMADEPGYGSWLEITHEVSAVPWRFLAIRRELFIQMEGFDEGYVTHGFDVDLALRISSEHGLRHLAVPTARANLAYPCPGEGEEAWNESDLARLWEKWCDVLRAGDPCCNPNLTLCGEQALFADEDENRLRCRGVLTAYDDATARLLACRL